MKIGYAQFSPVFGDKNKNLENIARFSEKVESDILVFPEMCTTGYVIKSKDELRSLAESIPDGPTTKRLEVIAQKSNTLLIVGLPEKCGNKIFDSAVIVAPQGYLRKDQKTHLFLNEKDFFDKGETKPTLVEYKGLKIGIGICYDYMFPEYWRNLALRGADLFCNVANFVYDYGFTMMKTRSIENGVFTICANRIGTERGVVFRGGSEIIDNRGVVLSKAGSKEKTVSLDVDLTTSRDKQWNPKNNLFLDRRPNIYKLQD